MNVIIYKSMLIVDIRMQDISMIAIITRSQYAYNDNEYVTKAIAKKHNHV